MPELSPVLHSILSPHTLIRQVLLHYDLGEVASCALYSTGFNDTYQVTTASAKIFFLRVYRIPWRTPADVFCELDALRYLRARGFPVAFPLPRQDGQFYSLLPAPEGLRPVVLFNLAEGLEPSYDERPEEKAHQYGLAVARLHNALEDFTSPHERFHLDLDHLVDKPLRLIRPFLSAHPELWAELERIVGLIRQRIVDLPVTQLEWGFCHGDLQGFHHRIAQDGTMTFIDFDCGGFGYRAYDLAVFRWCARLSDAESVWWQPYLKAYLSLRTLRDLDIKAIPLFVGCRYIWHMGVHCENSPDWGCGWLNQAYFSQKIGFLQQLESELVG